MGTPTTQRAQGEPDEHGHMLGELHEHIGFCVASLSGEFIHNLPNSSFY